MQICQYTNCPNYKLGLAEEEPEVEKEMYQKLVGKLIYLLHTRLGITYTVNIVNQFMHNTINRLLLEAYIDAHYTGSFVNKRSTFGCYIFLGGKLVTWRSKKQDVVSRSTAESEFRIMAYGVCEILLLKMVLEDLKIQ